MVALDISETSKALAVTGGYITLFGLISYFLKERLYISEATLATCTGIIFGPLVADVFSPGSWVSHSESGASSVLENEALNELTFQITRIVIGVQVLFTGIALPKAYLRKEWVSLATLLGPIMVSAWFVTSLLIWGLIPGLNFLECLVVGACVTPTDPVLANSICKGRFAEKHVPLHVRNIILAESGANDGLGYPFLFIALYLILIHEPDHPWHTVGGAVLEWFYNIILYQITLSIIIGALAGYAARKVLRFAEERKLIDHESFLAFGVALTFLILGVVGILGSDDILACFVAGNAFTWDDWFRLETEDHAFQDVIDQLLSSGIFLYIGAILPWAHFGEWYGITPWRLVVLGILVMLVRRLPWVIALSHFIPALGTWREAAFAGFFGPIGVGAIFYTQVALHALPASSPRTEHLRAVLIPINYFLVFTSIIVHGITIPVGKTFHKSGIVQLTRSWTTGYTGNKGGAGVSRLPEAVEIGAAQLDLGGNGSGCGGAAGGSAQASVMRMRMRDEHGSGSGFGTAPGSGTATPAVYELADGHIPADRTVGIEAGDIPPPSSRDAAGASTGEELVGIRVMRGPGTADQIRGGEGDMGTAGEGGVKFA